ncbi:MAG: putative tyrosine-protein kinase in cps region [Verrucomicrobia bacterium ADurb.Bin345]|nr:MAG: putative tyrosine-protein kinase in cps region [Verrucomicrobia bacterium ADurb.Bin345]
MENILRPPRPPTAGDAPAQPVSIGSPPPAKGFGIADLKHYFHIVVKRIWLVALCFVLSLTVMVAILVRQVPVYRCRVTLLMSKGVPMPYSLRQVESQPMGDYLATQQLIIQSGQLISRARARLNKPAEEVSRTITRISVAPVGKTAFLAITVESLDPVLGSDMANALADEYLDFKAEERLNTSQATVVSLTQQANRVHEELKRAEERALEFARQNSVIAIQERGNVAARILGTLSSQAAQFRTQKMFLEAQQPLLSRASDEAVLAALGPAGSGIPGVGLMSIAAMGVETNAPAPAVGGLEGLVEYGVVQQRGWQEQRRVKSLLEARLAEYRTKFRDAHPLVQQTMRELKEVQDALNIELQFALRQYYAQLEALSIREQASKRVEQEWEEEALEVSRKQQEYQNIQRNFGRLQSLYDLAFNRLKEIDISVGIEPESVQIMERARPASSPVTPRKLQSIFIAALIGLGVGLGLVFGLEYIDDSLRYPEEVTDLLGLPFFGLVPAASWDPEDLRTHILSNIDQKSGMVEAYRNVRSALLFSVAGSQSKFIAMTSAVPKEGKTTTCLNLAVSLAQAGARILMVDSDMRRGELHKFFGLEGGRGLSDLLAGQAKPEAVIQRTGLPNLDLVATGPFPPNPAELVLRPEFKAFMDHARRQYDRILFDCPPVMAVSEAAILTSLAEGVVMVVWAGHTSRKLVQLAAKLIQERGARILGCVLNNLDFSRVGYYYYSTYYGYYDYDHIRESKEDAKT